MKRRMFKNRSRKYRAQFTGNFKTLGNLPRCCLKNEVTKLKAYMPQYIPQRHVMWALRTYGSYLLYSFLY